MLTNFPFPLIPIQVTLLDLFLEGYPAFFQSFVPDNRKVTGCFLPSVLRRAIPNALAILLATAALLLSGDRLGLNGGQISGAVYLMIGVVEAEALLKSCLPLNRLRLFLFTTACVGFFTAALLYHTQLKLPLLPLNALPAIFADSGRCNRGGAADRAFVEQSGALQYQVPEIGKSIQHILFQDIKSTPWHRQRVQLFQKELLICKVTEHSQRSCDNQRHAPARFGVSRS